MRLLVFTVAIYLHVIFPVSAWQALHLEDRLSVIYNKKGPVDFKFAFHNNASTVRYKQFVKSGWSKWYSLGAPSGVKVISNPVSEHDTENLTCIFALCSDGQVYAIKQDPEHLADFGQWSMLSTKLPTDNGATLRGKDNVKVINYLGNLVVMSRSLTNKSSLFWTENINGKWSDWALVGGNKVALKTDAVVDYNAYSHYLEAFAIMENNKLYRTWMTGPHTWVSWDETGYFAPTTSHAPIVQSMYNGLLNVFLHGDDGIVHHIWQTTCDHVPNPWGWCTWSVWYKVGDKIPQVPESVNTLSIGANIHQGIELFTVDTKGDLWHLWQLEGDGKWNDWEMIGHPPSGPLVSHATVIADEKGWWSAYGLSSSDEVEEVIQKRFLKVSAESIHSGDPVTVSWSIPVDEATHKDWIGIYPSGADNKMYVDFYYVGGGQNPLKDPVPEGSVTAKSYLPSGKFDYRYLVNKQYFDAVDTSLTVTDGPTEADWVQVYTGISIGLGKHDIDFEKCVKDGNKTIATFEEAFTAFENRHIYKGLELTGVALKDFYQALIDCNQTDIAKALEKFIMDLIKCTEGSCLKFVIDAAREILILYEDAYEIYGDILGANNSFKIKAYKQGGYCIGRVVNVCISLPS